MFINIELEIAISKFAGQIDRFGNATSCSADSVGSQDDTERIAYDCFSMKF